MSKKILVEANGRKKATIKQTDACLSDYEKIFKELGFEFGKNLLDQEVYLNKKHRFEDEYTKALVQSEMDDIGYTTFRRTEPKVRVIASKNEFHPIKQYLEGLSWDGKDTIAELCSYFENRDGLFPFYLKKWLTGAVAKVYEDAENKTLIIDGPQRIGKSFVCRWIGSALDNGAYFNSGALDASDKDYKIRTTSVWVWEIDELEGIFKKTFKGDVKNLLTAVNIRERGAFKKTDKDLKVVASFFGTVNNVDGFLNDPTGSTRFMVCSIESIDKSYSKKIDRNQLWAQAYHLYKTGYDWTFDSKDLSVLEENNKRYKSCDSMKDLIDLYFETGDPSEYIHARDMLERVRGLGAVGSDKSLTTRIGIVIADLKGVSIEKRSRGRVYVGIKQTKFKTDTHPGVRSSATLGFNKPKKKILA